jgi:hypothetical protein
MAFFGQRLLDRGSRASVIAKRHHRLGNVPRIVTATGLFGSRFDLAASLPPRRSRRRGSRLRRSRLGRGRFGDSRPWFRGPGSRELCHRPHRSSVAFVVGFLADGLDMIGQLCHCTLEGFAYLDLDGAQIMLDEIRKTRDWVTGSSLGTLEVDPVVEALRAKL